MFSNINQISLMGLESIGWARKNWSSIFIEHDSYSEKILSAIGTAQRSGIPLTIFNYPLCHLPERAWGFATQSISDWKITIPKNVMNVPRSLPVLVISVHQKAVFINHRDQFYEKI